MRPFLEGQRYRLLTRWPPEAFAWCRLQLVCITKADLLAQRPDLEELIPGDGWYQDSGTSCFLVGEPVYGPDGRYRPAPTYGLASALVLNARFRGPQLDEEYRRLKADERAASKRRLESAIEANRLAAQAAEAESARAAAAAKAPHDPAQRLRELEQRLEEKLAALGTKPPG
jgi:hypothetical protein